MKQKKKETEKIQESQEKLKTKLNEVERSLSNNVLNVKSKEPPLKT